MTTAAQWVTRAALLANVPKGANKAVSAIKVKCHLKNAAVASSHLQKERSRTRDGRTLCGVRGRIQDRLTLMLCFRNWQSHCLLWQKKAAAAAAAAASGMSQLSGRRTGSGREGEDQKKPNGSEATPWCLFLSFSSRWRWWLKRWLCTLPRSGRPWFMRYDPTDPWSLIAPSTHAIKAAHQLSERESKRGRERSACKMLEKRISRTSQGRGEIYIEGTTGPLTDWSISRPNNTKMKTKQNRSKAVAILLPLSLSLCALFNSLKEFAALFFFSWPYWNEQRCILFLLFRTVLTLQLTFTGCQIGKNL